MSPSKGLLLKRVSLIPRNKLKIQENQLRTKKECKALPGNED
jgi:hypothetical protein